MNATKGPAEYAREMEADAERYPEERGEILLEAAGEWRRAGQHDRAILVLERALPLGGLDADLARVSLAESYFALGREPDARVQLDALRSAGPSAPMACQLAGELLEERGEHPAALDWFDLEVSLLDAADLEGMGGPMGWLSEAAQVTVGGRRVREALGLAPDELDRAAPRPPVIQPPGGFPTTDEVLAEASDRLPVQEVRTLFWQVDQYHEVIRRWPGVFDDDTGAAGAAEYHARLEERWRELSRRGVSRLDLVPATADGLAAFAARTGGAVGDSDTRRGYLDEISTSGVAIHWPPGRNAACWCGTGRKYKNCCGRPATPPPSAAG